MVISLAVTNLSILKLKSTGVTLRFSILSIFVTLLLITMLSLIALMHYRFVKNMMSTSFDLMQEASSAAFQQVTEDMETAEARSAGTARLMQLNVIDVHNLDEVVAYTTDLILREAIISPSIESIYWADENGTFVMAERAANGTITSEIINRLQS